MLCEYKTCMEKRKGTLDEAWVSELRRSKEGRQKPLDRRLGGKTFPFCCYYLGMWPPVLERQKVGATNSYLCSLIRRQDFILKEKNNLGNLTPQTSFANCFRLLT
jgi:hypothetical protein